METQVQTDDIGEVDELHDAHMEIRHLRDAIGALRAELEESRFEKDEAVQKALAVRHQNKWGC